MFFKLSGIRISESELQLLNAAYHILFKCAGSFTDFNDLHSLNAYHLIPSTESGITMDVKPLLLKILCSIIFRFDGNLMDSSLLQNANTAPPMDITESGITIDVNPLRANEPASY